MNRTIVEIYTDGSCHTHYNIGAWAAILFTGNDKTFLKGSAPDTTHNRMELLAVIEAIKFAVENYKDPSFIVYTDSQYVFRIPQRQQKLKNSHFLTRKGTPIQNLDLVKTIIAQLETYSVEFKKVKAHQRTVLDSGAPINYNSEVDKLVRQMMREAVDRNFHGKSNDQA